MSNVLKRLFSALYASALFASAAPTMAQEASGEAGYLRYPSQDEEMAAAAAEARATLDEFLARLDDGRLDETAMLKVGFPGTRGRENIWVGAVRRQGDGFAGILTNQPVMMPGYNRGDEVTFSEDMVSDWSYEAHGHLWGNFTTRAMLGRMDPTFRPDLRALLSETPVEP